MPVVAIMMCAVALAGVVYAYSSTVNVDDNSAPITKGDFVLEVYKSDKTSLLDGPITLASTKLVVSTATTLTSGADSVVASVTPSVGDAYIGKIVVTSDVEDEATIIAANIPAIVIQGSSVSGNPSGSLTIQVSVGFFTNEAATTPLEGTLDLTSGSATVYYKITIAVTGDFTFANNTPLTDATNVMAKLVDQTFDLTFTAESV